jgi:hypothetical protein
MKCFFICTKQHRLLAVLAALSWLTWASPLFAARPTAAKLLPEKTVLMVSVPNVQELAQKFMNTGLGQMAQDPQMKPFLETLYGSMGELVETVKDRIGLSLSDIVNLPQGEVTLAMVEPSASGPRFVFILEAGSQIANARVLLERGKQAIEGVGYAKREENIAGVKCTVFQWSDEERRDRHPVWIMFGKDDTIAICENIESAKQLLAVWTGEKDARSLAENANYAAIAGRCRGSKDEEPQLIWYADPVEFMKKVAATDTPVQIAVAILPALGLDGLAGVGGSMVLDTEEYDTMQHLHVLLTSPRAGVLKAIAFEPGSAKPERWGPGDVASYLTLTWNFQTSLKAIETLFDSFRGEGTFAQTLQNFTRNIDVDVRAQIVPELDGRVSFLRWIEPQPVNLQSATSLVALKLKDKEKGPENLQKILDGIAKKFPDTISSETSAGKSYYRVNTPSPTLGDGREPPPRPKPCFGIVEDYLVISNQPSVYEQVLATAADSSKSLGNELEFKLIASKLERVAGETKPAMLTFDRPEAGLRFLYDLATSDRAKSALQRRSERNTFFKTLNSSLDKQPLPPFSVMQKYLAPGGSLVIDDDTGIHWMNFTLKRTAE